ncbi:GNAT family N-acetyltransferase [Pedobacter nyackensis]|uniref:GNAT family N-acetyltransferase n=1 Tax=Pedobacter nyackensis TaxID=475255 RepID=UPI00293053DF|nr:GNAT family N-acetyltransferase [Pedobacter nyackensis]
MIREACVNDAPEIAKLIILAMDDLAAKFVGADDPYDAVPLFEKFAALPANQYSYENILVYEDQGMVYGMISAYDGAQLDSLRAPFLAYLETAYGFKHNPEDETQPGEYYIDCVSVSPDKQGKGIGKELIKAMIAHAVRNQQNTLGLLVNQENPQARKLYENLGFVIAEKKDFMGGKYFHMQYKVGSK